MMFLQGKLSMREMWKSGSVYHGLLKIQNHEWMLAIFEIHFNIIGILVDNQDFNK